MLCILSRAAVQGTVLKNTYLREKPVFCWWWRAMTDFHWLCASPWRGSNVCTAQCPLLGFMYAISAWVVFVNGAQNYLHLSNSLSSSLPSRNEPLGLKYLLGVWFCWEILKWFSSSRVCKNKMIFSNWLSKRYSEKRFLYSASYII